jgi:hypothetical protein
MTAGIYDTTIEQGATFSISVTWKDSNSTPINLTGYTARSQFRKTYEATTTVLDLTTANSGISLGGTAGTITLTASATTTAALTAPSNGVWDLELVSGGGTVTRLLQGAYVVTPEATR